jgi:anti-sigma factor RsiW
MKPVINEEPVRSAIRAHAEMYGAPADLREEVMRSISAQERLQSSVLVRRSASASGGAALWNSAALWWRMGAAFAAGAVLMALCAGWLFERHRDTDVLLALAADHARANVSDAGLEVVSTNMHTVKPWLSAKLGYSPAVFDLADSDYALIGGRRGYLGRSAVAVMVYTYREHTIDVYVLPERDGASLPQDEHLIDGFNTVGWTLNGLQYLAVSDAAASRVQDFARRLEARQRAG